MEEWVIAVYALVGLMVAGLEVREMRKRQDDWPICLAVAWFYFLIWPIVLLFNALPPRGVRF